MNLPTLGLGALDAEFWRWMFVMTRIGAAMLAAPIFGAVGVPVQVRVAATGAVALLVCGWTPVAVPAPLFSIAGLVAVAGEVLVGLALGFVLQVSFAAPLIAAEVIGGSMGMSIASTADPNGGAPSPALGQYFAVVLTLVFLALGAHLQWIGLVLESYRALPPGDAWLGAAALRRIAGLGGSMFATAVAIALPVTLVLLIVQLVAGVLGRSAPSLNLFSLGLPASVLAGLAALIVAAPTMTERMVVLSLQAIEQTGAVLRR